MNNQVPKDIMLAAGDGVKKSNLDMVIDFLVSEPGTIQLTDKQKDLLHRIEVVEQLHNTGQYNSKELAFMHAQKCNQSPAQSRRDIQDAEYAFGLTRKSNRAAKFYRLYDRLEALFIALQKQGQVEYLPKVATCMINALKYMPEDKAANRTPAMIIMQIGKEDINTLTDNPLTDQEALDIIKKRFEIKGTVLDPQIGTADGPKDS